jgi:hypothetical protein
MIDRYVVSKSRMVRIACDGPLTAQVARCKLEDETKATDVEVEFVKKTLPRARAENGRKRRTKLLYK